MHILEAALAANMKPHPYRPARSHPAAWPAGAGGAVMRLSAGVVAIVLFVLVLDAASMKPPVGKPASAEEASTPHS